MNLNAWTEFVWELDKLKAVERKTLAQGRQENSAEHSWHLAMAVLTFHKFSGGGFDLARALEMALLHDVVEIDAQDTFIYGDQTHKAEKEAKAAARIFSLLPGTPGQELKLIWERFEHEDSPEARIVSALDRFLPLLSNWKNNGYSWQQNGVKLAQVLARNQEPIQKGSAELWAFTEKLLQDAVARGILAV